MLPLIYPFAAQSAANLFRARRLHRSPRFVELETGRIERHAYIFQHLADFRFGILDQALIYGTVNRAGLHRVDVPHESPIVSVKSADSLQAESEAHAGRIILFEVRE